VAQPTNRSSLSFEAQIKKSSRWFGGPNYQTEAAGFEAQTRKPVTTGFETRPGEIVATGFEVKPGEIIVTGFEAKLGETVSIILRSNH
jgi:hypothetical protein